IFLFHCWLDFQFLLIAVNREGEGRYGRTNSREAGGDDSGDIGLSTVETDRLVPPSISNVEDEDGFATLFFDVDGSEILLEGEMGKAVDVWVPFQEESTCVFHHL